MLDGERGDSEVEIVEKRVDIFVDGELPDAKSFGVSTLLIWRQDRATLSRPDLGQARPGFWKSLGKLKARPDRCLSPSQALGRALDMYI